MLKKLLILGIASAATLAQALPNKYVVVPNRSDSTIALLSTPKADILKKVTKAHTGFEFEPIYASSIPRYKMIGVSDRKNSQVMFFDNNTFKYLGAVPASEGMFHMWPSPNGKDLYAVADIDRVVDVISVNRFGNEIVHRRKILNVGKLFNTGKPHDVVADDNSIFVTMIGVETAEGMHDYVLKFNRKTLELEGKLKFTFDIHLGIPANSPFLLVPEQTAGVLNFVDKKTFKVVKKVENVPGSHGIFWNSDASKVYLANFTSQGPMSIYEVRQLTGTSNFEAGVIKVHKLKDAKAHNITVDFENQTMFVTHSGPNVNGELNTNVSVFSVQGDSKFLKTIETGKNPLGVTLIKQK